MQIPTNSDVPVGLPLPNDNSSQLVDDQLLSQETEDTEIGTGEGNPSTSNGSCQPRRISTTSISRPTSKPSLPKQTNISNYVSKKVTVTDKKNLINFYLV